MRAILEYGQFSALIQLPSTLPYVNILKPQESLSLMPLEEVTDVKKLNDQILEFRLKRQLSEDLFIYEFVRER